MPRSTMDAVGSKARCGSAVLISNERSTTSVWVGADGALVAPVATTTVTTAPRAATATLARNRFMCVLPGEVEEVPSLSLYAGQRKPPRLGRGGSRRILARLQPARGVAAGCDLQHQGVLARAAVECIRAARVEAAGCGGPRRVGDLA